MKAWTNGELDKIAEEEELQIASVRRDGTGLFVSATTSTSDPLTGAPPPGSAASRTGTKVTFAQASKNTSPSWKRPARTSTTSSMPRIAPSITAMPQASSEVL